MDDFDSRHPDLASAQRHIAALEEALAEARSLEDPYDRRLALLGFLERIEAAQQQAEPFSGWRSRLEAMAKTVKREAYALTRKSTN